MLGARDEQTTAGTRAPAKGQAYPAKDAGRERTDDMESEEENQPKDETNAPKGDPTVETFHLPPELDAFKDEALPKLQVKTPSKKLTEDELAALRRWEKAAHFKALKSSDAVCIRLSQKGIAVPAD